MNYSAIKYCDIANGTGIRTVLFVSGCRNRCKDCFQPETWSFASGEPFTVEVEEEIIASLAPDYAGLTLLGGDPFEPENQKALLPFVRRIGSIPGEGRLGVSGYLLDVDIARREMLYRAHGRTVGLVDIVVDELLAEEKDISLQFKGSRNQRVIDCAHYCKTGEITEVM